MGVRFSVLLQRSPKLGARGGQGLVTVFWSDRRSAVFAVFIAVFLEIDSFQLGNRQFSKTIFFQIPARSSPSLLLSPLELAKFAQDLATPFPFVSTLFTIFYFPYDAKFARDLATPFPFFFTFLSPLHFNLSPFSPFCLSPLHLNLHFISKGSAYN